jgi:hypothetical protein
MVTVPHSCRCSAQNGEFERAATPSDIKYCDLHRATTDPPGYAGQAGWVFCAKGSHIVHHARSVVHNLSVPISWRTDMPIIPHLIRGHTPKPTENTGLPAFVQMRSGVTRPLCSLWGRGGHWMALSRSAGLPDVLRCACPADPAALRNANPRSLKHLSAGHL